MTKKNALVAVAVAVLLGIATALVLASRGGSGEFRSDASGGSGGSVSAEPATRAGADSEVRQVGATAPLTRAVISTGQVTLRTEDLARSRSEVVRLVGSWGGSVADEQSTSDEHGRLAESTLTLRVPSEHFEEAMSAFGTLGEVEQRSQKSEDVTTKVIDNDARVRAGERSIRQIEALLSRAQKLGDIIAIESDLARRQADLDSLKSQQAWLADQTSLSTITVYLNRPAVHVATHEAKGFLVGLENGWHALGGATVTALTVLGALLPFLVLLTCLGVPLWWVVRRRRPAPVAGA